MDAFVSLLPCEANYERMKIMMVGFVGITYEQFVEANKRYYTKFIESGNTWFDGVIAHIKRGKGRQMDLESCALFQTTMVFFANKDKPVFTNDR